MAGNELIAGIAGLAEGIGGFFSERHKLRLEKEQKKERKDAADYAKTQQGIENQLQKDRLDAENKRIDQTAKSAQDRIDLQKLTLDYRQRRDAATDALAKKKVDLQYGEKFAALGENVFDIASYIDSYSPGGPAPTMPTNGPSSPAQPSNLSPWVNLQPGQNPNPQSNLGVPSPLHVPQLQQGQTQGQPQAVSSVRPGTVTPDTKIGAGITAQQATAQSALAGIALKDAQIAHTEAETYFRNLESDIKKRKLPKELLEQQAKLDKMADDHELANARKKVAEAEYDSVEGLAALRAIEVHVAKETQAYKIETAKSEAAIKGLDVDIKKGENSGFTPQIASKGRDEAKEASALKTKITEAMANTEASISHWQRLLQRNGEPIPNPKNDKTIAAENTMMPDALQHYGENMKIYKALSDQMTAATYHEAEGNYLNAMGTTVIDASGKVDTKATNLAQMNARSRYDTAKKDYDTLQNQREKETQSNEPGHEKHPAPIVGPSGTLTAKPIRSGTSGTKTKKAPDTKKTKPMDASSYIEKNG